MHKTVAVSVIALALAAPLLAQTAQAPRPGNEVREWTPSPF